MDSLADELMMCQFAAWCGKLFVWDESPAPFTPFGWRFIRDL